MIYFRKNWGGILNRQIVFCKKESRGNSWKERKVNSHAKERGGFFREESLKIEGDVWGEEKEKRRVLEEFGGIFLFFNEIQKKIVDKITFSGGTSKGRIGWFGDSLWWRNTRARSKKQTTRLRRKSDTTVKEGSCKQGQCSLTSFCWI